MSVELTPEENAGAFVQPVIPPCPGCGSPPATIEVDDVYPQCKAYRFRCGRITHVPLAEKQADFALVVQQRHWPYWQVMPPSQIRQNNHQAPPPKSSTRSKKIRASWTTELANVEEFERGQESREEFCKRKQITAKALKALMDRVGKRRKRGCYSELECSTPDESESCHANPIDIMPLFVPVFSET